MRQVLCFLTAITLLPGLLRAADDPKGPMIRSSVIHVFDANISGPGVPESAGQELSATRVQVEALGGLPLYDRSAILIGLGYGGFGLDWKENPHFTQDWFNTVSVSVGLYTKLIDCWRWMAVFQTTTNVENGTLSEGTNYRAMLWGKYGWSDCVNLHIGAVSSFGMHRNNIYPLIGFDWEINDKWVLDMVFPIKMALSYRINDCWIASVRGQFVRERHRLNQTEALPSGIFEYRMIGGELAITYKMDDPRISITGSAGYSGDHELKVWNKSGGGKITYDIDNAFFIGIRGRYEIPYERFR